MNGCVAYVLSAPGHRKRTLWTGFVGLVASMPTHSEPVVSVTSITIRCGTFDTIVAFVSGMPSVPSPSHRITYCPGEKPPVHATAFSACWPGLSEAG